MMENRVELSPAASTTSATVCMVLFVILISSGIRKKKRRVWLYSDESVQMQILDRMLITSPSGVLGEQISNLLLI